MISVAAVAQPDHRPARLRVRRDVEQRLARPRGRSRGRRRRAAGSTSPSTRTWTCSCGLWWSATSRSSSGRRRDGVAVRLVQRVDRPPQLLDRLLACSSFAVPSRSRIAPPGGPSSSASPRASSTAMPAERTYWVTLSCSSRAIRCRSASSTSRWRASGSRCSTWRSSAVRSARSLGLGGRLVVELLGAAVQRQAGLVLLARCAATTAAWLARIRSTDRSPARARRRAACRATSAADGAALQRHRHAHPAVGSVVGARVAWPARIAPSSRRTYGGQAARRRRRRRRPGRARRGTAAGRRPGRRRPGRSTRPLGVEVVGRGPDDLLAAAPRGPSTVRTSAREIESSARTARCIRSSERTVLAVVGRLAGPDAGEAGEVGRRRRLGSAATAPVRAASPSTEAAWNSVVDVGRGGPRGLVVRHASSSVVLRQPRDVLLGRPRARAGRRARRPRRPAGARASASSSAASSAGMPSTAQADGPGQVDEPLGVARRVVADHVRQEHPVDHAVRQRRAGRRPGGSSRGWRRGSRW